MTDADDDAWFRREVEDAIAEADALIWRAAVLRQLAGG